MTTIREAVRDDMPGLAQLRAAWISEQEPASGEDPHFETRFREWTEANPRTFFVAHQDDELIGMLNILVFERMPKPGKEASRWVYLGNTYVLPDFRNAGLGSRLVQSAIEFSRGLSAVRILLSPSAESRSFYARLGFEAATELSILRL